MAKKKKKEKLLSHIESLQEEEIIPFNRATENWGTHRQPLMPEA